MRVSCYFSISSKGNNEEITPAKIIPILSDLIPANERVNLCYFSKEEQLQLLELVKAADESAGNEETLSIAEDDISIMFQKQKVSGAASSILSPASASSDGSKIVKLKKDTPKPKEKSKGGLSRFLKL